MRDAVTRALERAIEGADLAIALRKRRSGQPYDAPTLVKAQAITVGDAHLDWRRGLWESGECKHRWGHSVTTFCDDDPALCIEREGGPCGHCPIPPCPLCLGSGLQWSEHHAELGAYAGEASLFDVVKERDHYDWAGIAELPADDWVGQVGEWSPLAPVAAALGVAREWNVKHLWDETDGFYDALEALGAVLAYLFDTTSTLAARLWGSMDGASPATSLVGWVHAVQVNRAERLDADGYLRNALAIASRDLAPDVVAEAARAGVRRWVLRCFA